MVPRLIALGVRERRREPGQPARAVADRKVDRVVALLAEFLSRQQLEIWREPALHQQIVLQVAKRAAQPIDDHEH
jgi:hypothetical protein